MRATVTLALALCALILRVRPAHCRLQEHPDTDQHKSHCDGDSTIMKVTYYVESALERWIPVRRIYSTRTVQNNISIPYGASVDMWCGGPGLDADKLIIKRDGKKLVTKKKYQNIVVWYTRKLDLLKSDYLYECIDVENVCNRSVITLEVTPRLEVISRSAQMFVDDIYINYTVQYGDPVSVLCSGPDAARLLMSQDGEPLLTERESSTTIKHYIETGLLTLEYICTDLATTYNKSVLIQVVPTIYLQSQNDTIPPRSWYHGMQEYWIGHGDPIEIYCSGPRAIIFIGHGDDDMLLQKENFINVNETTVQYIHKLQLGSTYFNCSDSEFADYVSRVCVTVTPRMEVRSPNVRRYGKFQYGIKYGDPLEIVCSGTDKLDIIYHIKDEIAGAEKVGMKVTMNETAIKYILKEPGMDKNIKFYCSKENRSVYVAGIVQVGVLPADVKDFGCVSHNGQYLNCSWTASSKKVNFTLSLAENSILTFICEIPPSSRKSKFCVLDYEYNNEQSKIEEFVILLQSCNSAGCSNQTFQIDHLSVVKPASPWGLKVFKTTPRAAVLKWFVDSIDVAGEHFTGFNNDFLHKVQYWYSGIDPREVNSSLVTCTYAGCKIELSVPCPGQFYEVSIYQKLKRTVRDFWSEPSCITFYTDSENDSTNNVDPTCYQGPKKNKEVMTYFVQELRQEVRNEIQPMKQEVRSLQDKLANIRKHLVSVKKQYG